MLELTLTNGRTVKVLGLAAQHRALLDSILHRHKTQTLSPLPSTARLATTPGQSPSAGNPTHNMDADG